MSLYFKFLSRGRRANAANAAAADEMRLRQGQRVCEVVGVDPEEIAQ